MDPSALDMAIQHALAGLYPPFEATAPTVLGQVFRLLDSNFQGDGLSFLLDFLIPAKRLCEQVQEAACAPYAHCLFLHEGWPLCLRDEVVVHLAPLNPLLLRQGDFYLQVEPREEQSVCMTLKCLSSDLCKVDKKPIPESSYSVLFTPEWLEAINSGFDGCPLHNCLVASENGITTVPWTRITSPKFVDDRPPAMNVPSATKHSCPLEIPHQSSPQEPHQTSSPDSMGPVSHSWTKGKGRMASDKYPGLIKVEPARAGERAFGIDSEASQALEGDYVALLGSSQEGSRQMVTPNEGTMESPEERLGTKGMNLPERVLPFPEPTGGLPLTRWPCTKTAASGEGPHAGYSGRKARHKPPVHTAEPQPQQLHLDDPEKSLDCASDLVADIEEEPAASKGQGPLGMAATMLQQRPGPRQASSPRLSPAAQAASVSQTNTEETTPGRGRAAKPTACLSRNTSSRGSPTPGLQFPFLKGQRPSPVSPEKALPEHAGLWKGLCSLDSLQSCKTKASGKDRTSHHRTSGPATDSDPLPGEQSGFRKASAGLPGSGLSLEERSEPKPKIGALGVELLHSAIACLPGGRDRVGRPLLLVSTGDQAWEAPWCTALAIAELLSYLCSIPRWEDRAKGLLVVVDARKGPPRLDLVSALQTTQALAPTAISTLLFLGEKASALQLHTLPVQVEVLTSLKALSHHVDPSQLPEALGGAFPYRHSEWVQFFQKLDPFLADLHQASSLLRASIQEFEKGDPPGGVQEANRCLSKSKELMEAVLRDPGLLGLQREGGATLVRLRQEATRLDSNCDVRSHLVEAAALYSLVDEQLHVLVTASNQLLGRLELRVRLGHLESAIHQVSDWMEQEGSRCLQALTPVDVCAETVERAYSEFEDFFLQASAQYCRGLELSKQAAQLESAAGGAGEAGGTGGTGGLPELAAFASTQRAFQARLTHFYMAAERQRTDLETLLHLHRFSKKMSWFLMDCQDLLSQLRLGKAPRASPGDERRLHRYLQRLVTEFPVEKLAAMRLQVASLSQASLGQELWEEAREQHQEIQSLLRMALAHCPGPAVPTAHSDPSGPAAKGQGLPGELASRWDQPLMDSLGVDHKSEPRSPPQAARGGQNRNAWAVFPPQEAAQAVDAEEERGGPELSEATPEGFLASAFCQQLPRQSQALHPTGGSFSSEGTDSQISLENSPQTSPRASL